MRDAGERHRLGDVGDRPAPSPASERPTRRRRRGRRLRGDGSAVRRGRPAPAPPRARLGRRLRLGPSARRCGVDRLGLGGGSRPSSRGGGAAGAPPLSLPPSRASVGVAARSRKGSVSIACAAAWARIWSASTASSPPRPSAVGVEAGGDAVAQHHRHQDAVVRQRALDAAAQGGAVGGAEGQGALRLRQAAPGALRRAEDEAAERRPRRRRTPRSPSPAARRRAPAARPPARRTRADSRSSAARMSACERARSMPARASRSSRWAPCRALEPAARSWGAKSSWERKEARQRRGELLQPPLDLVVAGAQALGDLLAQLGEGALDRGGDLAVQLLDSFRKGHPLLSAAVL